MWTESRTRLKTLSCLVLRTRLIKVNVTVYSGTKLHLQELIGDEIKRNNLKLQQGLLYYQKPRWVPTFGSSNRKGSVFVLQSCTKIICMMFLHSRYIFFQKNEVECIRFVILRHFVIHVFFYLKESSRRETKSRKKSQGHTTGLCAKT